MLEVEGLTLSYGARTAVRECSFSLPRGGLIGLIGPNGAGKSSLLKALAGLRAARGRISWDGRDLAACTSRERARIMAYLPQSPVAHWPVSVRDLVALGRLPHQTYGRPPDGADVRALEWAMRQADVCGLAGRSAGDLSGGERARVQLARALAVQAPVLLVDEPVACLDPYHQLQIMAVLGAYAAREAVVIAVLHDLTLAGRFCRRVLLLHEGALVEDGTPEVVLSDAALRRYYRVQAFSTEHDNQALVLPWTRVD